MSSIKIIPIYDAKNLAFIKSQIFSQSDKWKVYICLDLHFFSYEGGWALFCFVFLFFVVILLLLCPAMAFAHFSFVSFAVSHFKELMLC